MAVALGVAWGAYIRVSEVSQLHWGDIALPGDFRLNDVTGCACGLNIKNGKPRTTSSS